MNNKKRPAIFLDVLRNVAIYGKRLRQLTYTSKRFLSSARVSEWGMHSAGRGRPFTEASCLLPAPAPMLFQSYFKSQVRQGNALSGGQPQSDGSYKSADGKSHYSLAGTAANHPEWSLIA